MAPDLRIGISGWRYEPWRGVFYPPGLVQREELQFASRALPTIEINGTFYSMQKPEYFAEWRDHTPDGFVFAVKGPKYITHVRRLKEIDEPLANFMASGLLELGDKLGPLLWQFPPFFRFDAERMGSFLAKLPHDTEQAARLAQGRSAFMKDRESLAVRHHQRLRHAVEIRHESFVDEAFVDLLRQHNVALVVADTAGKWPYREDVCADFMYLRLHGDEVLYASGYSDPALDRWADRIRAWSQGGQPSDAHLISASPPPGARQRDIYCYFDNDVKVKAPFDALKLLSRLGQPRRLPDPAGFTVKRSAAAEAPAWPPEQPDSDEEPRKTPPATAPRRRPAEPRRQGR